MNIGKICPVMSTPYFKDDNPPHGINVHVELMEVQCIYGRCFAWKMETDESYPYCEICGSEDKSEGEE